MRIMKSIANYLFATFFVVLLFVFLVFMLINIAYSKRGEIKLSILAKLADFHLSCQSLYLQGSAKALEFKLAYKNNRLS